MNTSFPRIGPRLAAFMFSWLIGVGPLFAESAGASDKSPPVATPGVVKRYDKNKNGVLDEAEAAKWQADLAERREKYARERAEILAKYDTDQNGKISEAERVAAKLGMGKERTERDAAKAKEKDELTQAEKAKRESEAADAAKETGKGEDAAPAMDGAMEETKGDGAMMSP